MQSIFQSCFICLKNKKLTIAFAESVTSGALCYQFGMIPGSGEVFIGGLVFYDGELKKKYLGVTKELIDEFTPESAEVTRQMALGLKKFTEADVCVAITGLSSAGGSESKEKPVGTIFTHILLNGNHYPLRKVYSGSGADIIDFATKDIIAEVLKLIES